MQVALLTACTERKRERHVVVESISFATSNCLYNVTLSMRHASQWQGDTQQSRTRREKRDETRRKRRRRRLKDRKSGEQAKADAEEEKSV